MLCLSGFELYSRWVPLRKLNEIISVGNPYLVIDFGKFSFV